MFILKSFPEAFVNPITINRVFFHFEMEIAPLKTPLSKWELQYWTFSVCKFPSPKLTCSVSYIIIRTRVTNASGSCLDWLFKLSSQIWVHSKAEMLNCWNEGLSLNVFYLICSHFCEEKWHWKSPHTFLSTLTIDCISPSQECLACK